MDVSFIEQQAHAWAEIREWAQEAEKQPLIPTAKGGSWDGPGSSLDCTDQLFRVLPGLLKRLGVCLMLDVGCGDWNWMRLVDLTGIEYTGWDVDPGRIARCRYRINIGDFTTLDRPNVVFDEVNILTVDEVPLCDLILCRDVLAHLPTGHIQAVLQKFRASGSEWLLASTYPGADNAFEYNPSEYAWNGYMEHPVDLEAAPFNLEKIDAIPEQPGPGGVINQPHELGLFLIGNA
jgi:SAM-dependent methyltransferase